MAFASAAQKRKPRRNVRLHSDYELQERRRSSFSFQLFKFFVKKVLLVVGFIVLTLFFIFMHDFLTQSRLFAVETIEVKGNKMVSAAEIVDAAGLHIGDNIIKLNVDTARLQLLTHDWIQAAEISREMPRTLMVEVVEEDPLICVDLGQIFIVNRAGFVFKPAMAVNTSQMPTVRGLNIPAEYWVNAADFCLWTAKRGISPFEVNKLLALRQFLEICEQNAQDMGLDLISDIETDGLTGITAILRDGRIVRFGFGNLEQKFKNYNRFAVYAQGYLGGMEIQTVDLRDAARVVVRQEAINEKTQ